MDFDAIIIGAGPAGLAAAARLSHFGKKVCLVEAHTRLGGLNSWYSLGGKEVSAGLHAFTNHRAGSRDGPLAKLLRQLRIKESELELRPQVNSSVRFPSAVLNFNNDPEFLRQQVAAAFPGEIDGFDRFRRLVRETDEGEITRRQISARDVLAAHIANPLLIDMLFCPVMFYGNPGGVGDGKDGARPSPDMDWLLFCVLWKCMFESGLACPAKGVRPIWESLADRIRDNGSVIKLGARVKRLAISAGKVDKLVLSDGSELTAEILFSSAGRIETLALCGLNEPAAPTGSMTIAEGFSWLDSPAPAMGMTDTVVFYSFTDDLRFRQPEGLVNRDNGVVCALGNYSYLPGEAPPPSLKVSQLANFHAWKRLERTEYADAKQVVAEGMEEDLRRLGMAPGRSRTNTGKFGFFDDVFTPTTIERYTGHAAGALYGSPAKSRSGETGCSNLFLIGTDQGFHGIVGAMLSGVAMANMHALAKTT